MGLTFNSSAKFHCQVSYNVDLLLKNRLVQHKAKITLTENKIISKEAIALKQTKITLIENRQKDAWFDMGLRQLRVGEVRFYKAIDLLTGEWLFKVCSDAELGRFIVKAVKCPPGKLFVQLEGDAMVFQKSVIQSLLYDIISLTRVDEDGRVRREAVRSVEEIPPAIMENFEVKPYEEATGKQIPGKYLTTLCKEGDEKAMITLFLMERAWSLSPFSLEEKTKTINLLALIKNLEKTSIEEIHQVANQQFGIGKEEIDILLTSLEKENRIKRLEGDYVKAID